MSDQPAQPERTRVSGSGDRASHAMTNTHILFKTFDYREPASLEEAAVVLRDHGDHAQVMAGGTNLLVWMKMEQAAPEIVVNIGKLAGLEGFTTPAQLEQAVRWTEGLEIGALTTIWDLRNAPILQRDYTALAEACRSFGSTQIQLTGTIGGNVCNASPASDAVPALMALGAEAVVFSLDGERLVPIEELLLEPGKTAMQTGELLSSVRLPAPEPGTGSGFIKISRVRADLAKASVAAKIVRDGDCIADCRIAFGSVGPTVTRVCTAEQMLIGERFSEELGLAAGRVASEQVTPIDDIRSSAWYRREMVKALAHDVLQVAWRRAGDERRGGTEEQEARIPSKKASEGVQTLHVGAGERRTIELTVNGVEHHLSVRSNELLINVLRERLSLTGTKYGCGIGECGACTVHLNGVPTLACLTLAIAADGQEVTTVEGLEASSGVLDPLQEAFIDSAAFQCGYCTPGMLMMTKRLLAEIPSPTEDDIRDYLKGNRCRCTGFASITRAVKKCIGRE